jgi:hypothetical protein
MAKHSDCAWQWPPWPSFNPDARCPKCGCDRIATTYYQEDWYGPFERGRIFGEAEPLATPMPERLRRECERCGHWWCESVEGAVNDQAPTGPVLRSTLKLMEKEKEGVSM